MKKVGIVTWLGSGNYGTSLQAFALHRYLEKKGYNVSILGSMPNTKGVVAFIKYVLHLLGLLYLRTKLINRKESLKHKKIRAFRNKFFNVPILITPNQRKDYIKITDVFIAGSDQIWNTYHNFNPFMFLDFAENKKKISYASSIGTSSIKDEYKEDVKKLLNRFYKIGVREKSALPVLSEIVGRNDIVQVLDPTFLLNKNDWQFEISNMNVDIKLFDRYIFCYLIGKNECYREQLLSVKRETGIENVIIVSSVENPDFFIDNAIVYDSADPLEFVKLLNNSTFVCTDSFHATALSINLGKNFVEFLRFNDTLKESQNSRIYDVLSHYDLMDRIFNIDSNSWKMPINYAIPHKILLEDRSFSETYLTNAIEGE